MVSMPPASDKPSGPYAICRLIVLIQDNCRPSYVPVNGQLMQQLLRLYPGITTHDHVSLSEDIADLQFTNPSTATTQYTPNMTATYSFPFSIL